MNIDVAISLGDLVIQDPRRSRVLAGFGIDYCCNGHRSLEEAAQEAGLDLGDIVKALDLPAPAAGEIREHPRELSALAHDIIDTHHAYIWEEVPRLKELMDKVHRVHGDHHPELTAIRDAFNEVVDELDPHLTKEERAVFPAISKLEKAQTPHPSGSLKEPIEKLRAEHDELGQLLRNLRELTDGYTPPADGCTSYRLLFKGLEEMEFDLHEHIHKENNILFPRVLEFEQQVTED